MCSSEGVCVHLSDDGMEVWCKLEKVRFKHLVYNTLVCWVSSIMVYICTYIKQWFTCQDTIRVLGKNLTVSFHKNIT